MACTLQFGVFVSSNGVSMDINGVYFEFDTCHLVQSLTELSKAVSQKPIETDTPKHWYGIRLHA